MQLKLESFIPNQAGCVSKEGASGPRHRGAAVEPPPSPYVALAAWRGVALVQLLALVQRRCSRTRPVTSAPFVFSGTSGTFVFVHQAKSWINAQSYCRQNYTDLASVRNQAENEQLVALASGNPWSTHIGLYRDSWKWSDGSSAPFTNWDPGVAPTAAYVDTCVASYQGSWINVGCNAQMYFVCFVGELFPAVNSVRW